MKPYQQRKLLLLSYLVGEPDVPIKEELDYTGRSVYIYRADSKAWTVDLHVHLYRAYVYTVYTYHILLYVHHVYSASIQ